MISNILSSIGVTYLLLGYYLDIKMIIPKNLVYYTLNITGGIFAGSGAFLVQLWPLVFLEIVWVLISLNEVRKIINKGIKI
jgi:hypothetical protein